MHRSGTSLVSKIIESQGVFMGHKKQGDNESVFFLRINEMIFNLINATWDTPDNFTYANSFFRENIKKIILRELTSKDAIIYFGLIRYLQNHNFEKLNYSWGWKDPRNTFTFPFWKDIFPQTKIIHIYRNPVDVAHSLRNRQLNYMEKFKNNERFANYALKINFLGTSYKCLNMKEGFLLWEKYIAQAFELGPETFHIKFEDLVSSPETHITKLIQYINAPLEKTEDLKSVTSNINNTKRYAFVGNPELETFYTSIQNNEWVKKLNYHNILNQH